MRIAAVIRTTKKIYNLVQHIDCRNQFEFSLHPGIVLSTVLRIANIIGTTVVPIDTSFPISHQKSFDLIIGIFHW